MRRAILFIVGCCFSLQFVTHARAGACVEVALVLAIDASNSFSFFRGSGEGVLRLAVTELGLTSAREFVEAS
jgi:hypothetical protein